MNLVLANLKKISDLNTEEETAIKNAFKPYVYKKGDYFLKEGSVCRRIGFIESGSMYYSMPAENGETICDFAFEQQWCTQYKSLNSGQPSEMSIIALEDTIVHEIENSTLTSMSAQFPKIFALRSKLAEVAFIEMSQRSIELTTLSAEERYNKLMKHRPHILRRAPLSFVASYLGITQRHLSRLRGTSR